MVALKEFADEFSISEKRSTDLCNYFYIDKALGNAPESIKYLSGFGSEHTHGILLASCWALKEYRLAYNLSLNWSQNESSEVAVLSVLVRLESLLFAEALFKMRENIDMHSRLFNSSLQWAKIHKKIFEWMKLPLHPLEINWFISFLSEFDEDRDALIIYYFLKGRISEGVAEYSKYEYNILIILIFILENLHNVQFRSILLRIIEGFIMELLNMQLQHKLKRLCQHHCQVN